MHCQRPIVCPPRVYVRDYYAPQVRQYVHPQVTINRIHRVLINQHSFPRISRTVTDFSQYNTVVPSGPIGRGPGGFAGPGAFY